jgi:hypothetical protein
MEVLLKKTKITASILKQMQHAKINQLWQYQVLGYFVKNEKNKKRKYVLLKDTKTDEVCIWQLFHAGRIYDEKIMLFDESGRNYFTYDNSKVLNLDMRNFAERLKEIRVQALELGQIFY